MRRAGPSTTVGCIGFFCTASLVTLAPPSFPISRRRLLAGLPALICAAPLARAQERPEKASVRLALGGKTTLTHLPLTIADQLGYFKAEGLEVEFQDHAGDGLAQQSMLQGQADMAAGGFEHTVFLRQRGAGGRAFVFLGRAPQMVFGVGARALPNFQHITQLKGRRIGVASPENSSHWFARMVLARGGLAPGEAEFLSVGTTSAAVASSAPRELVR